MKRVAPSVIYISCIEVTCKGAKLLYIATAVAYGIECEFCAVCLDSCYGCKISVYIIAVMKLYSAAVFGRDRGRFCVLFSKDIEHRMIH